jgi:FkbM family methyltransferase
MSTLAGLLKIEYIYQPKYLFKRMFDPLQGHISLEQTADFPLRWGLTITANPNEEHGRILNRLGIIDLNVTESIWRLLKPGSTFLDVGANIGYMTSVAIARLESFPQSNGKAIGYEPHPGIYTNFLQPNVDRWKSQIERTQVILHQVALSDRSGMTELAIPVEFGQNQGLAQVIPISEDAEQFVIKHSASQNFDRVAIECQKLDDCLASSDIVDVMKIDVEGHELAVFKGGLQCLEEHRIHHIIFEAHDGYPTPLTDLLKSKGYEIFGIDRHFGGPKLVAAGLDSDAVKWLPKNYIATCRSPEVMAAFSASGWQVFQSN